MQQAATSRNIDNKSSVPSTNVTDPALGNIDDEDRNQSNTLPASFYSGLLSLHGFAATRMVPAIVHAVCEPLKTIGCQRKILKKYMKVDGQRRLLVGKIIVKEKVHYVLIIILHGTKQQLMHYKCVCMMNFRTLIATLKYHRCYRLFAMQQKVHQPSFYCKNGMFIQ